MSDARSLLRAKKAQNEVRISHPYAAYNASGQLRCTVCVIVIKNAVAWNGHLGSKAHRTNVAALKAKELEAEQKRLGKRKEPDAEDDHSDANGSSVSEDEVKKRRLGGSNDANEKANNSSAQASAFPTNFFSDPNRVLPQPSGNSEDEGDADLPPEKPTKDLISSVIDREWEEFERTVLAPANGAKSDAPTEVEKREAWNRATIFVEPELVSEVPEGFPPLAPVAAQTESTEEPKELTEEEIREKKAAEERELIMDRLMDEERAQEEADARVTALKSRLDGLKKRREAARLSKLKDGAGPNA